MKGKQTQQECIPVQWRIQDFPRGGAPTPKIAIIFHIFAENCMKMKEFGPPGGARIPGAPLGSANAVGCVPSAAVAVLGYTHTERQRQRCHLRYRCKGSMDLYCTKHTERQRHHKRQRSNWSQTHFSSSNASHCSGFLLIQLYYCLPFCKCRLLFCFVNKNAANSKSSSTVSI